MGKKWIFLSFFLQRCTWSGTRLAGLVGLDNLQKFFHSASASIRGELQYCNAIQIL